MKISVILAHPNPASFNHAIANICVKTLDEEGHEIHFHDLYAEKFDSILPYEEFNPEAQLPENIKSHCIEISESDGIIIVHPNWWGQPPAILKGWIDRVIRPGVAFKFLEGDKGEGIPMGLLKAQAAIVFNTSNTPREREHNSFGDPLERLWKDCVFDLCGVRVFHREMFRVIVTSTAQHRRKWLHKIQDIIRNYF